MNRRDPGAGRVVKIPDRIMQFNCTQAVYLPPACTLMPDSRSSNEPKI
jgi:hypothetical protein